MNNEVLGRDRTVAFPVLEHLLGPAVLVLLRGLLATSPQKIPRLHICPAIQQQRHHPVVPSFACQVQSALLQLLFSIPACYREPFVNQLRTLF